MSKNKRSLLYAFLAILFWGTAATAFKIALNYLSFIQLLAISSYTSVLIFFTFLVFQKKTQLLIQQTKGSYLKAMALGFLNPFAYYLVLFKAYSLIPAQIAQPLNFIWPIVLVVLSIPILKHKVSFFNLLGLVVSFAGAIIISSRGNLSNFQNGNTLGLLLAAGSSIIWALYWIGNMNSKTDTIVSLFLNFTFSSVYITIIVLLTGNTGIPDVKGIFAGIYVGFFEMGLTYILWMKALNYASSAARIGNLVYLTPFLSLICIHFILKENIYYTTFAGLVLIIAGILISNKKNWKKNGSY